jgi:hypothetical protein
MDSYHTNLQLPFDVLGLVFSHYAEEENIQHPLETLLLVCRSWSNAALGHRALWRNFRILIGHEPTISIWNARLPLRLARRAPDAPLDIMLRNLLDSPYERCFDWFTDTNPRKDEWCYPCGAKGWFSEVTFPCRCVDAASACVDSCLKLLTGKNGELSRQWRSFALILGDSRRDKQSSSQVKEALSYPAPTLSSLVLRGLLFSTITAPSPQLFPDTGALKHLTLLDCDLSSLPEFGNPEEAEVGFTDIFHPYYFMSSFRLWTTLQRLSLWISAEVDIELPSRLNDLRRLDLIIDWEEFPSGLLTCEMPHLTTLSLDFHEYDEMLQTILQCQGINWSKLTVLRLGAGHSYQERGMYTAPTHSLIELLTQARNLEYLYASKGTMGAILQILGSTRDGGSSTHVVPGEPCGTLLRGTRLVNVYDDSTIKISGRESEELFKELFIQWGCA